LLKRVGGKVIKYFELVKNNFMQEDFAIVRESFTVDFSVYVLLCCLLIDLADDFDA